MTIQALTGRDTDASSHSDYLARTHGQAICVCNEPDNSNQRPVHPRSGERVGATNQVLMTEKIKMMVSDSDNLSVRHLYGTTRDMPIMWKLVLGGGQKGSRHRQKCCATRRHATRSWMLRPLSGRSLCRAPPRLFWRVRHRAPRRSSTDRVDSCGAMFRRCDNANSHVVSWRCFSLRTVVTGCMPPPMPCVPHHAFACFIAWYDHPVVVPSDKNLESEHQLQELSVFRMYLRAFLRPSGTLADSVLSLVADRAATAACKTILELHGQ